MHTVLDRRFKLLAHLPYFLDLAPSDYFFFFSKLKKELRDQRYLDDDEPTLAVEELYRERGSAFYRLGINALLRQ